MAHWSQDVFFYHLYPLGQCGAPERNDLQSQPVPRLEQLHPWLDHARSLGVNALYLGPVFESTTHGYDTADYFHVDRRLGSEGTLTGLVAHAHRNGIRVLLDGVFNHVGRDFWAFRDVREHGRGSRYASWFRGLRFEGHSALGDPFVYDSWNGHQELVRLELRNPEVREHLFLAIDHWIRAFDIDGLRLDVADQLDLDFQQALRSHCRSRKPDFFLLGEVIHGDYRRWVNPQTLDSVTNYECYKGLFSSHVARNYFEIAYSLNRQFGDGGIYRGQPLYNFADNHDVNRVASQLTDRAHLFPLYAILFTMPGMPSLYYGSEWGLKGQRDKHSDRALRPALDLASMTPTHGTDLLDALRRLAQVRASSAALRRGSYRQLFVGPEQLAFRRDHEGETVYVLVNSSPEEASIDASFLEPNRAFVDLLNPQLRVDSRPPRLAIPPRWARVLRAEK